jgi:hypothetical protein
VVLESAGMNDKWVYHIHNFYKKNKVKAIGMTRIIIWKSDISTALSNITKDVGATEKQTYHYGF